MIDPDSQDPEPNVAFRIVPSKVNVLSVPFPVNSSKNTILPRATLPEPPPVESTPYTILSKVALYLRTLLSAILESSTFLPRIEFASTNWNGYSKGIFSPLRIYIILAIKPSNNAFYS